MRTLTQLLSVVCVALALLGSPAARGAVAQPSADARPSALVVIVARGLEVHDMSLAQLRRVFRGDETEINGQRLVPFNYAPEDPVRRAFDLVALGMTHEEVGRYWVDRRIRGQGMPPRTVPTPAMARAVVARLRGAIAYVQASQVDATVQPLTIGGKHYSDPNYPLSTMP